MTTTTTPVTGDGHRRLQVDPGSRTRRQAVARNRGRIAAGVFAIALAGLLAVLVYGNVGQRNEVLAVARTVDPGQVISAEDVKVVRVAADPDVHTIAASARSSIIGQRAAVRLLPGSLLSPDAVTKGDVIGPGFSVIGAIVKPGQYPLGLRAGDRVEVVVTGGLDGDRPVEATIVAVASTLGTNGTAISLAVPDDAATRIAVAGSQGQLLLIAAR